MPKNKRESSKNSPRKLDAYEELVLNYDRRVNKSKQKEGLAQKQRKKTGAATKEEAHALAHRKQYESVTLTESELGGFPVHMWQDYLRRHLEKKYNKPSPTFHCNHCAMNVAFNDTGYITDEELLVYADGRFQPK